MASIAQKKWTGRFRIQKWEQGSAVDIFVALTDWYEYYRNIDGLRPRWIGNGAFHVFREADGVITDTFSMEVV